MKLLGDIEQFQQQERHTLNVDGLRLLLINHNSRFYLIEDKCGHFGSPLSNGRIEGEQITCVSHGIAFSLVTGEITNRPYENCDAIKVYRVVAESNKLYFE